MEFWKAVQVPARKVVEVWYRKMETVTCPHCNGTGTIEEMTDTELKVIPYENWDGELMREIKADK
jgi:hypothetical protein